jgi:hypothetical protein
VRKNTEDTWVIKLIILMFLSCVGGVGVTIANWTMVNDPKLSLNWQLFFVVLQELSGILRDGGFNASHWMFAYQYLLSAVEMDYVYVGEEMPVERKNQWNVVFWIVMILNLGDVIIYNGVLFGMNWHEYHCGCDPLAGKPVLFYVYTISRYTIGVLQLVSGVILLVAVYKVR